ncbi:MAG: RagB/SusD family nutrient uptake outer membrane protein [Breznakibacter sp.]
MKKILFIAMLAVCMVLPVSCLDDILDQKPLGQNYSEVFWVDQQGAEKGLAGSYALFRKTLLEGNSFMMWGEFPGRFLLNTPQWITGYVYGGNFVLPYWEYTREWEKFYQVVTLTNIIQKRVPEIPLSKFKSVSSGLDAEKERNRILGEALFLRAYSYFWMVRIWGDVPYVTEAIESSDQLVSKEGYVVGLARTSEIEVLKNILVDLDQAKKWLSYDSPGSRNWAVQANKGSVEALEAHVAAWLASRVTDGSKESYLERARIACNNVITNSGAKLVDYSEKDAVVDMFEGQSSEGLFELNINASQNESFRVYISENTHIGITLDEPFASEKNDNVAKTTFDFGQSLINRNPEDYRIKQFFYNWGSDGFLTKYSAMSPDQSSTDRFAYFTESNVILMRLADIILLRAEVLAKQKKYGEAVLDLNTILNRANLPNYDGSDEDMLIEIFNQRGIELVGEGHCAFDRIRFNYFEGVDYMSSSRIQQKGYFWPIQGNYLLINRKLVQNDYWRGKL